MNQHLQTILNFIQQDESLTAEEKNSIITSLKNADKELEITAFKLDRTEKVKRTTAILLEETIEELEQKRKAVEAQNREAQIENALEKVRSRTMAMQRSEELPEAANNLFLQVQALGIPAWSAGYCIWDEDKQGITFWMSSEGVMQPPAHAPLTVDPSFIHMKEAYERGDAFHVEEVGGEALVTHYQYMRTLPVVGEVLDTIIAAGYPLPTSQIFHCVYFSQGFLLFITYETVLKAHDIFKRFGNVFEQTYTRFLDLKKAEAQAREAQIEAALERVRSKSMAMHHSDDLITVINIVQEQLIQLGFHFHAANFVTDYSEKGYTMWLASPGESYPFKIYVPQTEVKLFKPVNDAVEKGLDLATYTLTFEEKNIYFRHFFENTLAKNTTEKVKQLVYEGKGMAASVILLNKVRLNLMNLDLVPYTNEENTILKRFGYVFEQSYTRFLDLKKAEAQAREAQIQLALERVRARTMAMQHSDELKDAAGLLFQQAKTLGVPAFSCGYNIWKKNEKVFTSWMSTQDGSGLNAVLNVPLTEDPNFIRFAESRQKDEQFFILELRGERMQEHYRYLKTIPGFNAYFDFSIKAGIPIPETQIQNVANFSNGNLLFITAEPCPEFHDIFKRFAAVFEQTYTRFLDLKKAEAQAREAQIEATLEKVRSRSLAMHNSSELREVVKLVFEKLQDLNFSLNDGAVSILIFKEGSKDHIQWIADPGQTYATSFEIAYTDHPLCTDIIRARESGLDYFSKIYSFEEKNDYFKYLFEHSEYKRLPDEVKKMILGSEHYGISVALTKNSAIVIPTNSGKLLTENEKEILKRFAKVFEQSFTRFLDLQKAEAQAKEATIEAALERVRARTMAMHSSEDVVSATSVLLIELRKLGIETLRCGILIFGENETFEVWSVTNTEEGKTARSISTFNTNDHPLWQGLYKVWKERDEFFYYYLADEEKKAYYRILTSTPNYLSLPVDELPDQNFQGYNFPEGTIWTFSLQPHSEEDKQVMKRFTAVFSLTFRRYRDLQKAEAQAREAKIEAALERVRGKAMAMHSSEDLAATIGVFYREMESLSATARRCGIGLADRASRIAEISTMNTTEKGDTIEVLGKLNLQGHPVLEGVYEHWLSQKEYHPVLRGAEIKAYYQIVRPHIDYPDYLTDEVQHGYFFPFPEGDVFTWTEKELAEDDLKIYRRFTTVLSLTYKRYKDLKQAEDQAREATIEAALEKVRGKAMAMHNSNDLIATASIVFTELRKLGINSFRSGVGLLTKENRKVKLYAATSSDEGDNLSLVGWALLEGHEVLSKFYDCWISNEDYFPVLKGELLTTYYEKINATFTVPLAQAEGHEQYGYVLPFSEGLFYGWAEKPYTDAEIKILKRFATVIDLTFRRYIELQKSEANAVEAIRRSSLDRVRAETASMRTTRDLERITPLIWNELTTLGVPFIRCGVFIMDEKEQQMHTFLSTPDGKAIAAFHLPYDTPGNFADVISHWQQKKKYLNHWGEVEFSNLAETLVKQGSIASREQYLSTLPKEGIHLHFLPFLQGMLYVGNNAPLSEDGLNLVQGLADAFSTAYARYEDFNKLELAKEQIEKTLVDLKQAQAQLVQSEKMASLGELTAGIAHEIQNPLNFVNNFSEVNTELIDELKEEIAKGNMDEVIAIANDIKENELKINHHGKRADAIVKGMLQHSRTSTATKEPTNINALADEYLRLAYHGLRAKDKSFNATLKTDFDETIGNINVIPQDIGRVILNLITNAFYVTNEKQKAESLKPKADGATYEPTVSVNTKKTGDKVFISVKDNGNGIPQKVVDKIFQPFFTTKPTGQGTGLGLSLAYDIVKAHSGEIKVNTVENEGTEFTIAFPA